MTSQNSNVIEFDIGVANVGDAPADDVTAEFWFPDGYGVTDDEPEWPKRPTARDGLTIPGIYRAPHPLEMNASFKFGWTDDGTRYARIRVRRLMQDTRETWRLWATIVDDTIGGFPVEARVLVASPALTIKAKLNIRVLRGE